MKPESDQNINKKMMIANIEKPEMKHMTDVDQDFLFRVISILDASSHD